jgi:hypothetical protein
MIDIVTVDVFWVNSRPFRARVFLEILAAVSSIYVLDAFLHFAVAVAWRVAEKIDRWSSLALIDTFPTEGIGM